MKTLSEVLAEEKERLEKADVAWAERLAANARRVKWLEEQNIPVYVKETTYENLTDYDALRKLTRAGLIDGSRRWSGIACDHCKTELCEGNETLLSSPPSRRLVCPGCGFVGYRNI